MATPAEQRYGAAIGYVRRAIDTVDPPLFSWSRLTSNYFASSEKVKPAREDLLRIDDEWQRATSEEERLQIAREAELLADRVQESLPGAPQDRSRTNLYVGELQSSTVATSYARELTDPAREAWHWLKEKVDAAEKVSANLTTIGLWIGGVYLGVRALEALTTSTTRRDP